MRRFLLFVVVPIAALAVMSWLLFSKGHEAGRTNAAVPLLAPLPPAVGAPALMPRPAQVVPAAAPQLSFHGFPCTQDCSGHEAGYAWAERHNADSESNCTGPSSSFVEGCLAYVREQKGESIED